MNRHKEEEWNVVLTNDQYGKGIKQMYRIEEGEGKRGVLKPLMV